MADNRDEAPPITACRLYEKTSKAGNIYLTGRLGGVKVLIFKSREPAEDGTPVWDMKFSQAAPYQAKTDSPPDHQAPQDRISTARQGQADMGYGQMPNTTPPRSQRPVADIDEIPF